MRYFVNPVIPVVRSADIQPVTILLEAILVNVTLVFSISKKTETAWTSTSVYLVSQFVPVKPNVKILSVHMIAHVLMDTKSKLMKLVTRKGQVNESQTRDLASPV